MLPPRSLHEKALLRRASRALTVRNHSQAATPTATVLEQPRSTVLYTAGRKQPRGCGHAPSKLVACSQSVLPPSSPVDRPRLQPRLTDCELLISVLESYMTLHIRRNDAAHPCERTSPTVRHPAPQRLPASQRAAEPSVFHALQPPSITPVEYLRRLARYAFCSRSAFILAFYYLQTIANLQPTCLTINSLSIHRLLLTATLLATKMVDDILYDNAHFAKVGGLDLKELNMLELQMLTVLRYQLCVSAEQYEAFERSVLNDVFACEDSQFSMLHERLRNMGYSLDEQLPPCSPVSSLDDFGASDA